MAQGPAITASSRAAEGGVGPGESDDRVFRLDVAADQLVGLADPDEFLYARHFVQRAGFDFAAIPGDADGCTLGPRHGMGPVAQLLDLLTNRADLLFRGLRLHHH